jgi:hypothetical protein
MHTMVGTPQEIVADVLGIDSKTLRKHYRAELDMSKAKANAQVCGTLFKKCLAGDTTAMIFWLKTQAQWKETHVVEHGNSPAEYMTDAELERIARAGGDGTATTQDSPSKPDRIH